MLGRWFGEWEESTAFLLICVLIAFFSVGVYLLWDQYGDYVMSQQSYRLSADSFETTDPPQWIVTSNVEAESVLAGGLSELSIRQPELTVVVGQAFAMHPWVKKVKHVTKRFPARVLVELEYRQPVAMVEVPGGRLPVDVEGVLLPTTDFSAETADRYLRISAGETTPLSNIAGTRWGDERIHEASRVAAFLLPYAERFAFSKVIAYRGPHNSEQEKSSPYFVLRTKNGGTLIWARAPGSETAGEPLAEQKIARLKEFVRQQGGSDLDATRTIDLRAADGLRIANLGDEDNIPVRAE